MNKEFQTHKLNEDGVSKANQIADHFDALLESLKEYVPESREFSIVKTKLEEASFFAKKAIAAHAPNQVRAFDDDGTDVPGPPIKGGGKP